MNLPSRGVLRSKEAEVLRQDVRTAFEGVQHAQHAYEHTLAVASDTDLDPDGFAAFHRESHAYAATVMNYSNAVMALLSYLKTGRRDSDERRSTAMDIIIEPRDGFLLATAIGQLSFDSALQSCQNMCDIAARFGLRKILFDCLAVQGDLSLEERFELGKKIAEYCQTRLKDPAVALIGKPPSVTGYGARVASNVGMPVEMFSDRERGLDWLRSRP